MSSFLYAVCFGSRDKMGIRTEPAHSRGGDSMEDALLTGLIRASLWGEDPVGADRAVYEEMKAHAIHSLPAEILPMLSLEPDLLHTWEQSVYLQIFSNVRYRRAQDALGLDVPYVILKGTEAAKYYPHPEYRAMGDIDIMTGREDYDTACRELIRGGFSETTDDLETARGRHRKFKKGVIAVEIHAQYAHQNDPARAAFLDNTIIRNIRPDHTLPDRINGLVLLDHINHHMEVGLGLRQILDWMLYVDKCLPDEVWPEFKELAEKAGLEKLAVSVTRMCELYLGLPERKWCAGSDPEICRELWKYVLSCGNFGRKQEEDSRTSALFFGSTRTWREMFTFLQERGLMTWDAARKYRFLGSFAWLYQACKYVRKGLGRDHPLARIREEMKKGPDRNHLFDELGVTREDKGLVVYRNGRYVKTHR